MIKAVEKGQGGNQNGNSKTGQDTLGDHRKICGISGHASGIKCEDQVIGYYRIWHDPETESIAFYSGKEEHGVLPPKEYRAVPSNHKMIRCIEEDLNRMGYTIPEGHRRISDGMLLGLEKFPQDWDVLYQRS